jgi:large subunit ribosomal protein L17
VRHQKSGRQLGRNTHHRLALFRSLVTSLLEHERIETTEAKAKEIRILADRMITLGKNGSLHARRRAASYIRTKTVISKLFKDLAGRFSERKGGYTRLIKTRRRVGDAAPMVVIELVSRPPEKKDVPKEQPAKTTPRQTKAPATA